MTKCEFQEFSQLDAVVTRSPSPEDIDVRGAWARALARQDLDLSLAILAGLVTFVGLSMVRPLYTSEARILIENDVSPFTRTADRSGPRSAQQLASTSRRCRVRCRSSPRAISRSR